MSSELFLDRNERKNNTKLIQKRIGIWKGRLNKHTTYLSEQQANLVSNSYDESPFSFQNRSVEGKALDDQVFGRYFDRCFGGGGSGASRNRSRWF